MEAPLASTFSIQAVLQLSEHSPDRQSAEGSHRTTSYSKRNLTRPALGQLDDTLPYDDITSIIRLLLGGKIPRRKALPEIKEVSDSKGPHE